MTPTLALALLLAAIGDTAEEPQKPKPPHEEVVVTASRTSQTTLQSTALADVLSAGDLELVPALTLDDQLRRVPGFSLFRRTSSLTAHPTTQGVSLRGIGPSGASRSLVLFDGVPLNDPFGGWVYWNRFPSLLLDRVEVVRGSVSQLYGSASMAGAIQLFPRAPTRRLEIKALGGDAEIWDLEALASNEDGDWGWLASGRAFHTGGFPVAPDGQRGVVDVDATSEFQTFFGRVYRGRAHFGANLYHEKRGNGTPLQRNESTLQMVEGGFRGERWSIDLHAQKGLLENSFSRIAEDRSQEFPLPDQRFEYAGAGASFQWRLSDQALLGADWRLSTWERNRQNLAGVFLQTIHRINPRLEWQNGVRADLWQNRSSHASINPRSGVLFRAATPVTLRASAYRGFRAPTLNELYRPFRVGNVVTEANPGLDQERLWGLEGGADFFPRQSWLIRLNAFWNRLQDPVGNVTLSISPSVIVRQRQNTGRATIRGVEAESILQLGRWRLRGSYLYSDSRFVEDHLRVPQAPRHQAVSEIDFRGPFTFRADARWIGPQFDDDLNLFKLGGYVLFDASLRKPIGEDLELFISVENILDRQYPVAATPIERLGEPRLIQAGVVLRLGKPTP